MNEFIKIKYQGIDVGAVAFDVEKGLGSFEYERSFIERGLNLAPLKMPLKQADSGKIFMFPNLNYDTFRGLPGMLADSLPDDFGNAVLNSWLARQGKNPANITPLQRLQYTGKRGMGALEYYPSNTKIKGLNSSQNVALAELVKVAQSVLDTRHHFHAELPHNGTEDAEAMKHLLQVGMSAGGARPKAVLAFNETFTAVRSGQVEVPEGFTHYLMKFDGVSEHHQGKETFGDPMGYGAMEYVYYLMATNAGINMAPSRLLNEGERRHFLTQRFDRVGNKKIHMQTLNAIAHVDYKKPGLYSYYELFHVVRELQLSFKEADQLFRRMVFNVIARNHDDHSKNFAFLMDNEGKWRLSPAYDLAYSYKPGSKWVNSHWMTINNKRDNFVREDFYSFEDTSRRFTKKYVNELLEEIKESVSLWPKLAKENEVPISLIEEINSNLRLNF
ncbi:toxin HipA [Xenorhabdus mauleonii]|uniref:Serine/threonine-protein kinase HipA n=1 Tax=Xenorhabdus mauleonii TaxID=351675 RepID=A0A1I3WGM3_9GAMM|nr:toxin HipA [Xenorhabdus mauleonii]SFK06319.1 serine/threonine-protein kinase HipA [Xenorhabdus mauleonii]